VLVTTRSNKIALFPNRTAFNYVITAVAVNNENILLDATSKSAMPNILPIRALNWTGRLIKNDGSSAQIDLMPKTGSREIVTIVAKMDETGKITGKARDQYYDYQALSFRENYGKMSSESYIEKMEKVYSGLEVQEYKVSNDDLSKPVVEDYEFSHNTLSDVIGDKIYISPMLFCTQTENPFRQEKREYPIDFVYPSQSKYMINVTMPEGYVIESSPESVAITMEENIGTFKYNIQARNNVLQLNVIMDINYAMVPHQYYLTLKDFFQKMIEKQTEKIILTKKV